MYRGGISDATKRQLASMRARGECTHLAPLGYLNVRDCRGRPVMVPDPRSYGLVAKIHTLKKEGWTHAEIATEMNRLGLRSKRGDMMNADRIRQVLKRPAPSVPSLPKVP